MKNDFNSNDSVHFEQLNNFKSAEKCDLYIITRESLFVFSKAIKSLYPKITVVGEIHTPLQLLDPELDFAIEYIDYFRVATDGILEKLSKKIPESQLFQYPVSINHLSLEKKEIVPLGQKINFLIYSRFDEYQKDIAYAIRLMDHFVNIKKQTQYFLYLNGTGGYEKAYHQLISFYKLEKFVFINNEIPEETIYLSTARCETLGYSILEAFTEGNPIILYKGDDHSLADIYGEFESICWLEKDIATDAQAIERFLSKDVIERKKAYEKDLILVESSLKKGNYAAKYIQKIPTRNKISNPVKEVSFDYIEKLINQQNNIQDNSFVLKAYLKLKELPIIGTIVKSEKIKKTIKSILSSKTENLADDDDILEGELREDFIFVESFHGKSFAGDPKHLALYLQKKYPSRYFYVSSVNELVDIEILQFGMIPVRIGGARYIEKFRKSKLVIMNGNSLDKAKKVKGQVFVETWHGFPLKKMVADLENIDARDEETKAFLPRMRKWDYLLTSSQKNLELFESAFCLSENTNLHKLILGAPRNNYLIANRFNEVIRNEIIKKYFNHEDKSLKYILYCPTWRKDSRKKVSTLDLSQVIKELPNDYRIIVKLHPLESHLMKFYNDIDKHIICFPNELSDIQELFLISDILITDYSSAMFDYAHMNKKIIVLQEDVYEYQKKVGWYFDLYKETGLLGKNYSEDELIQEILTENNYKYNEKIVTKFLDKDSLHTNHDIIDYLTKKN
ncbi:CDP-glycerol glycerophosphotransferase family protein [Candidatus Enterococcus willemsii]|nr:CDP-glycerol glycerophosphotransferase family protein [Enterococcus sp. CU12B]